jgi:hypothetical protein
MSGVESHLKRVISDRRFAYFCFAAGAALILLNIVGLVVPLRSPYIYHEPRTAIIGDTNAVLTAEELWRQARPRPNEPRRDYARRATRAVEEGIAFVYGNHEPALSKYNWRIPIWENYLLWASRHGLFLYRWACGKVVWSDRGLIYAYVFSDYHRIIRRGVGLCGQQTVVLMGFLKERGIATHYVNFRHHSLVEAEVDPGIWWVLDPTFNSVLPYDVATLRKNPHLIRPICLARGNDEKTADFLESVFSEPPPYLPIFNSVEEAHGPVHYYFEYASYYLIWIIPVVLIITGLACLRLGQPLSESCC